MRIIKTLAHLRQLRHSDVDPRLLDLLERDFRVIMDALRFDESEEEFSLEQHGYLVLLEKQDDLRNLKSVGLNPEEGGLLGTWPEWAEEIHLPKQTVMKVAVLYDNEYMMTFYGNLDHDPEALAWAKSHVG